MGFPQGPPLGDGGRGWTSDAENGPSGQVVVFWGDRVVRGTAADGQRRRPSGVQRVLLVGFGSDLDDSGEASLARRSTAADSRRGVLAVFAGVPGAGLRRHGDFPGTDGPYPEGA